MKKYTRKDGVGDQTSGPPEQNARVAVRRVPRTGFCKGDLLAAAAVLLAALLIFVPSLFPRVSGGELTLTVLSPDGSESYPLDSDAVFTVVSRGITLKIEISDRKARVVSSDCRDRICVNSGVISAPGQMIICAPAGVALKIVSAGSADGENGGGADVYAG